MFAILTSSSQLKDVVRVVHYLRFISIFNLKYLKLLNDAKRASNGFLKRKVLPTEKHKNIFYILQSKVQALIGPWRPD